tara:strand:+ start:1956 stop:2573 length:618 start_codon:yes stop_codon:yes gene_type:complete
MNLWTRQVSASEFEYPEKMDRVLIEMLVTAREKVGLPFIFHYAACPPDDQKHSAFSLHKWGIDHTASKEQGQIVEAPGILCKACDFHVSCDVQLFYDVALKLNDIFGGLGLYPHWTWAAHRQPGYHVDVRPPDHPGFGLRWHRDVEGKYHYHPKRHTLRYRDMKGELMGLGILEQEPGLTQEELDVLAEHTARPEQAEPGEEQDT